MHHREIPVICKKSVDASESNESEETREELVDGEENSDEEEAKMSDKSLSAQAEMSSVMALSPKRTLCLRGADFPEGSGGGAATV
ncbi:hypothetical protein R1flu_001822 [Riccia fluitans]|uniref:Uncharacterized protein n=1 Tax=Riccia fluitans TaxID=41844 RepID=A0ABD1Y7Q2_9MARC